MRISNYFKKEDLEQLRQIDLTRFITTRIRLVSGKKQTLCPFHEERTPSFFIYPDNSYHCYGCGAHGTGAIDFYMDKFGLDFLQACEELKRL